LGYLRENFLPAALVAEILFRTLFHVMYVARGQDAAGIDADHAHAVFHALAAERPRERDQRCVAGRAGDVGRAVIHARRPNDVDDAARAALAHAPVAFARQIEEAEDFEVPGRAPLVLGKLRQASLRDS